ncbi:hypothetical protein BG004_000671, partial [Podila humilis]
MPTAVPLFEDDHRLHNISKTDLTAMTEVKAKQASMGAGTFHGANGSTVAISTGG